MASVEQSRLAILHMIQALVDGPGTIIVTYAGIQPKIVFNIQASSNEAGKLIGKDGRMADAIRNVVKVMGQKLDMRFTVIFTYQDAVFTRRNVL